ncbi:hypothetical protein [Carboxylicivirga sp. RSCT41]
MKKIAIALLILLSIFTFACSSSNRLGAIECPQSYYGSGHRSF